MEYISPFILPDVDPSQSDFSKYFLQLTQKKAMAEFELRDNSATIELEGHQLEKSRLLQLIAELNDPKIRSYHLAIYDDSSLLDFLTNGVLPAKGKFNSNPIYSDAEFIRFISPYFVTIYQQEIVATFR